MKALKHYWMASLSALSAPPFSGGGLSVWSHFSCRLPTPAAHMPSRELLLTGSFRLFSLPSHCLVPGIRINNGQLCVCPCLGPNWSVPGSCSLKFDKDSSQQLSCLLSLWFFSFLLFFFSLPPAIWINFREESLINVYLLHHSYYRLYHVPSEFTGQWARRFQFRTEFSGRIQK